jgi:hypothetical protein
MTGWWSFISDSITGCRGCASRTRPGFLDYWKSVVAAGGGQLFPQIALNRDGRKSTNGSRVLGEWLREVMEITDPRFVFHSQGIA